MLWSLCAAAREATVVGGPHTALRSGPRSPQLEKALRAAVKTQRGRKQVWVFLIKEKKNHIWPVGGQAGISIKEVGVCVWLGSRVDERCLRQVSPN